MQGSVRSGIQYADGKIEGLDIYNPLGGYILGSRVRGFPGRLCLGFQVLCRVISQGLSGLESFE